MQVQKDETQELILQTAYEAFLSKGYAKTTMRHIAERSGIGLSNIYNYFENKEAIFGELVSPLIHTIDEMVKSHHDMAYASHFKNYLNGMNDEMLDSQTEDYLKMIRRYRPQMKLLFFKAQGSKYETYLDELTDHCTQQVIRFMDEFGRECPQFSQKCSPFTYHLHTVWMFNLLCEIIKHNVSQEETERVVREYLRFEYIGWRDLINQ